MAMTSNTQLSSRCLQRGTPHVFFLMTNEEIMWLFGSQVSPYGQGNPQITYYLPRHADIPLFFKRWSLAKKTVSVSFQFAILHGLIRGSCKELQHNQALWWEHGRQRHLATFRKFVTSLWTPSEMPRTVLEHCSGRHIQHTFTGLYIIQYGQSKAVLPVSTNPLSPPERTTIDN